MSVGLSFGNPTSGDGFDVSSTVSSIVATLQNVETPWKSQISALQSQDAVISSLGTLFSNLSTDISNLTDLTGLMAEKEGSSSDTSVLTLSSATSSAVAGTYTVTVKNLAATASGYLNEITSTDDTLSGSLTIQVGSGSVQTITITSSTNTLSTLASAINSAGIGVTANVLTDSSGSRLSILSGTSGANGNLTITSAVKDTSQSSSILSYNAAVTGVNASLVVNGVSLTSTSNTVSNLIPGVTFQMLSASSTDSSGSYKEVQVVIANYNTAVESAIGQMVSDYNLAISAINVQEGTDASGKAEPLFGSPTLSLLQQQLLASVQSSNPNGYMTSVSAGATNTLSGSIVLQVGTATAQTFKITSSDNTLSSLATAITAANIGVTASVVTKSGKSSLTFTSQKSGTAGALTVSSALTSTSSTSVSYTGTSGSSSATAKGSLSSVTYGGKISGKLTVQVGTASAQTISISSSNNTLSGLANSINSASIGVTASLNSAGTQLILTSQTSGSAGNLTVSSSIQDLTDTSATNLYYTNSSDINSLTALGITVSTSGKLSLDATSLDSLLNNDYSAVVGFFQNSNSWGQNFSTVMTNAGSSATTGTLHLASLSNSSQESTLTANISREDVLISAQQSSLTKELTSANEILQEIPMYISEMNMLYSAITGYNKSSS